MIVVGAAVGAGLLFVVAYGLFAWREQWRTWVAAAFSLAGLGLAASAGEIPWSGVGVCQIFGYRPPGSPWGLCPSSGYVEWDTLGLLLGLFALTQLLAEQGIFQRLAWRIAIGSRGRTWVLFAGLSLATFALSAFVNSITVMLVMAAVTLEICRNLGRSPLPYLMAEISASNAGGAATFVGDPPNVILGTYFGLSFNDFLAHAAPLALAGFVTTLLGFWLWHRRDLRRSPAPRVVPRTGSALPPLKGRAAAYAVFAFALTLGLLVINPLIPPSVGEIGLAGFALAILGAGRKGWRRLLKDVDWGTLGFFFFLFLLVGSLEATGDIGQLAQGISRIGGTNALLTGSLLLWLLGLLSSVIDNVPLAATAAPLIGTLHAHSGIPIRSLVYPTAVGVDIGGNGTPIGATANVVGLAVARQQGSPISWRTYVAEAFPIMVAALASANLMLFLLLR